MKIKKNIFYNVFIQLAYRIKILNLLLSEYFTYFRFQIYVKNYMYICKKKI